MCVLRACVVVGARSVPRGHVVAREGEQWAASEGEVEEHHRWDPVPSEEARAGLRAGNVLMPLFCPTS